MAFRMVLSHAASVDLDMVFICIMHVWPYAAAIFAKAKPILAVSGRPVCACDPARYQGTGGAHATQGPKRICTI